MFFMGAASQIDIYISCKTINLAPSPPISLLCKKKADAQKVHAVCHIITDRPGKPLQLEFLIIAAYALIGKFYAIV